MYKKQSFNRIKNVPEFSLKKDFSFSVFSFLLLGLFFLAGIIIQSSITGLSALQKANSVEKIMTNKQKEGEEK